MRLRWIILLGRVGSVLLVIGLSFMLISQILMYGQKGGPSGLQPPGRWFIFGWSSQMVICHPSKGVTVSMTTNNTLQLYFINMHPQQLSAWAYSWVREHYPSLNGSQVLNRMNNKDVLEAFLMTHPEILLNEGVNSKWFIEYFPPKVVNITMVLCNSLSTSASFNMEFASISTFVPRQNAIPVAEVLIAVGVVFALPFSVMKIKDRVRSNRGKAR